MLQRLRRLPLRPLAAIQIVALLVWALGSVVWAQAPDSATCPMMALQSGSAASVDAGMPGCCQSAEKAPSPKPAKSPCKTKGSCCCPMVAPVLPDAGTRVVPAIRADLVAEFGEPMMLDLLAPNALIVPPSC